jgi:hypothetical protein
MEVLLESDKPYGLASCRTLPQRRGWRRLERGGRAQALLDGLKELAGVVQHVGDTPVDVLNSAAGFRHGESS